jgi:tetratricopeptide (TPR) repeat protein
MAKKWVVVGGGGNGIIVRSGKDVSSSAEAEKLATGAVVTEQEISGTRMKYAKVSGSGPQTGWVSISAAGKDLLVEVKQSDGGQAADALTKVVSGAFDAEEALAIFDSLSNKKDKAAGTLLTTIPDLFLEEQNPVAAVNTAENAVEFFKNNGDKVGLATAYTSLANAQFAQELPESALASSSQARAIFRELGDTEGQASVAHSAIRMALGCGNSAQAIVLVGEIVSLARQKKDSKSLGAALLVQSEVLLECGRSDEASRAAREAHEHFGNCGEKRDQAKAALARAYAEMGTEYGEATASARAAANIYADLGDVEEQAGAIYILANAHLAQVAIKQRTCIVPCRADTENCINAANEAIKLYSSVGNRQGQELAGQILQTVMYVNGAESNMIMDERADTQSLMSKIQEAKYGGNRELNKTSFEFNRQKFSWRDAIANNHYTLVWEHQVQGTAQNKRAGYKTTMISQASRSASLPFYHCLKSQSNGCSTDEGPLVIHMGALNSSWEYGTGLISAVSTISALTTCKVTRLVYIQVNESPSGSVDERSKVRPVYMSPVTLSILRSARLEAPNMTIGFLGLDTSTWQYNRAEVIASLPDVMQSEESEIHYYKGTPIAPTLIQRVLDPAVKFETTKTVRVS